MMRCNFKQKKHNKNNNNNNNNNTESGSGKNQILTFNKRVAADEDLRAGFFIKKKSKFKMKIQSRVGTRGWNDAQSKGFITEG